MKISDKGFVFISVFCHNSREAVKKLHRFGSRNEVCVCVIWHEIHRVSTLFTLCLISVSTTQSLHFKEVIWDKGQI